jgi:hypothetical protein
MAALGNGDSFKRKSYHKDAEKIMNSPDRAQGKAHREKGRGVKEINEKEGGLVKNSSRHVCSCCIN